jgi:aspartokinase/homoserine dehydrogenase 1
LLWDETGLPDGAAAQLLDDDGKSANLDELVDLVCGSHLERTIIVDATASDTVARRYAELLERGIAVVTPNKRANTMEQAYHDRLQRTATRRGVPFLYETTVGAALPIITVLADVVRSGDRVRRIEGVLSGTLAFVFNRLADGCSFSEAVVEARSLGFTEPDPRDDLRGDDVARKILTLAREAGWRAERSDIEVESLVPAALETGSVEEFLSGLAGYDDGWRQRLDAGPLQYVAVAEPGHLQVGVRSLDSADPFARLDATDNMVIFTTDRYSSRPLIVQGAGAGPDVTAGGMIADVVRAAESMA